MYQSEIAYKYIESVNEKEYLQIASLEPKLLSVSVSSTLNFVVFPIDKSVSWISLM